VRKRKATRRRSRLSTKARASLKLRGRYMGLMKNLKRAHKARVRKVKEAKGFRAAIAKARRLAQGKWARSTGLNSSLGADQTRARVSL